MSFNNVIGLFYLSRGLGSPHIMEMVVYSQGFRDSFGDQAFERESIVVLEGPGETKPGYDFCD